jgi:hypothetical protein
MNTFLLVLVGGLSLASLGVAVWTWLALTSVSESAIDFGRFEAKHFEIE